MTRLRAWISAARLRTLPLSVSGIVVGSALGHNEYSKEICISECPKFYTSIIFWLAIATTLGLQILSNFANDYGDGVKGTDNENRIGPQRAIQSGAISKKAMKAGILVTALVTLLFAIYLIYASFGKENFGYSVFFFVLGLSAIVAAIKYTVGKSAYGYRGLGDVFVFIFFGLVSVVGCYFLYTKTLSFIVFLPAITIGLLSTAVLNLNNLRDYKNDEKSGKNTLVVKLGIQKAKRYHYFLVITAILEIVQYVLLTYSKPVHLLVFIGTIPLVIHLIKVKRTQNTELLDPELKKVALSTFLIAILFSLGQIL